MAATSEHFVVYGRYVSMEWLALSAPLARPGDVEPGVAPVGHRFHHYSSRFETGKGDRLCRSERISPNESSASASLASWPAWPIAAVAPCWPGDGARDAMRSPSRKRTNSRKIARRFA